MYDDFSINYSIDKIIWMHATKRIKILTIFHAFCTNLNKFNYIIIRTDIVLFFSFIKSSKCSNDQQQQQLKRADTPLTPVLTAPDLPIVSKQFDVYVTYAANPYNFAVTEPTWAACRVFVAVKV